MQGGGQRAGRARVEHHASVPVFTIRPAAAAREPPAPADPVNPNPAGPPAPQAQCVTPRRAGLDRGGGEAGSGRRSGSVRRAGVRASCPVSPVARGGRLARTPLASRSGNPAQSLALPRTPSLRSASRGARPALARAGWVPRRRGSPRRAGGRLSRLRLSFAGLRSAGMRQSMAGGFGSGSAVAPRLGRALRASFSGAGRSRKGEALGRSMGGWVEVDEAEGLGSGLTEGPLAAGRRRSREGPVAASADELLGGPVGASHACPGAGLLAVEGVGAEGRRARARDLGIRVEGLGGAPRGGGPSPDSMSLSRFPPLMCAATQPPVLWPLLLRRCF